MALVTSNANYKTTKSHVYGCLKFCVVGDHSVGKSSLLYTRAHNKFPDPDGYIGLLDGYIARFEYSINEKQYQIDHAFYDTAGPDDYDKWRPLGYPTTNVVFLC
eukprot:456877_1